MDMLYVWRVTCWQILRKHDTLLRAHTRDDFLKTVAWRCALYTSRDIVELKGEALRCTMMWRLI